MREPNLRLSYVTWEENGAVPIWVLEVVSKSPGGEYKEKKRKYAQQSVLYYIIYAPLRKRSRKLTIYRLNKGEYELLERNPVWMPEIGLGIGTGVGTYQGITREWLYWYDETGNRYLTSDEVRERERQGRVLAELQREQERRAREQAEQRAEELARRLRSLGIDPDKLER
ncbi:MAG: Uma2 family endonuclease [Cyanobacteriota bacterium]|nr:Uma2 family endonuclease [Cyanobacteriota bacterium]